MEITLDEKWTDEQDRKLVNTEMLGLAETPQLPYLQPDGKPYKIIFDYLGVERKGAGVFPGPFVIQTNGKHRFHVWPK